MQRENVELVRGVYESWNSDGLNALEPWLADGVELRDPPEMPDSAGWRGREAVVGRLEEVATTMGGGHVDFQGFRARGDAVLVSMVWQIDDTAGGAAFGEVFHLVRVADGKITSLRVFLDESAALDALGSPNAS
jgi:ketosteroid isomerase-like protein